MPLLASLLLAGACQSNSTPTILDDLRLPLTGTKPKEEAAPPAEGEDGDAIEAIRRGDYEEAHGILSRILLADYLAEARQAIEEGRPEEGLLASEAALTLFPRDQEARLVDARGRLALAEKGIVEGRPFTQALIQDALDASLRAGAVPAARLQAARAAYLLNQPEDALRYATEGMELSAGADVDVDRLPQRTLSEAAFSAFVAAKNSGAEDATVQELFRRTETALTSLLGRTPTDPWVHTTLANLYEWEGQLVEARNALMRGIDRIPVEAGEAGLVHRVTELARRSTDRPPIEVLTELVGRHPDLAEARWFEAEQRFYDALTRLEAGEFDAEEFQAAEAGFRKSRELKPEFDQAARGWEAICRNGAGWCLYQTGDIHGAEAAFRSMEDVLEGGLRWELEGRLLSGVLGLAFCSKAYNDAEDWLSAAEVNEYLRHYEPGEVAYANDAGFFFRDASVVIEIAGTRFCYAAQGLVSNLETLAAWREVAGIDPAIEPGSDAEREAFRVAADRAMSDARELMRKSADAYRAAAALAPDDVRIVNDTALVLMYYLHTDIDEAKAMLERCVELGAVQVQDETLEEEAMLALKSAWGDAHQNLGVLTYIYENDQATALSWFQKSMEIDPETREDVRGFWLPFLRGEIEAAEDEDYLALKSWAKPCD